MKEATYKCTACGMIYDKVVIGDAPEYHDDACDHCGGELIHTMELEGE